MTCAVPTRMRHAPALAALAFAACSDAPTAVVTFDAPVDLSAPWVAASPDAVGMDRPALDRALERAGSIPRLRSLVVVRRGRLVVDRYFGDAQREELADVRSVTKSVISTLTGLAVERGHLAGLDQPLGEILPSRVAALDSVERRITVRHLLTMSGGWEWVESGGLGYNEWIASDDPVAYLLERPHAAEAGTTFAYNSAAVHLLSLALEEAVGRPVPAFANEVLLSPLGIGRSGWEVLGRSQVNGGSGMDLRAQDLARLGQLFLQDGWSGGTRILPEGWVEEATRARWDRRSRVGGTELSYGYLWWIDELNDAFLAWGYGGQFIYVAPTRDLVVVTTTTWWRVGGESIPPDLSSQVFGLIVNGILPSAPAR